MYCIFLSQSKLIWVLSKLTFKPDTLENLSSSRSVWLRDLSVPSRIIEVSSAYCDILNSTLFTFNIFNIFLTSQNFISRRFDGTTAIFFKGDAFWTKLTLQCYIGNKPITSHMPKGSVTLRESFYNNQHFPTIIIEEEKSQKLPNISGFYHVYTIYEKSMGRSM